MLSAHGICFAMTSRASDNERDGRGFEVEGRRCSTKSDTTNPGLATEPSVSVVLKDRKKVGGCHCAIGPLIFGGFRSSRLGRERALAFSAFVPAFSSSTFTCGQFTHFLQVPIMLQMTFGTTSL